MVNDSLTAGKRSEKTDKLFLRFSIPKVCTEIWTDRRTSEQSLTYGALLLEQVSSYR